MNIYEFAMKMELDGKKYYEKLMNSAEDEGLKKIFKMLAQDEEEHHRIIKNMKDMNTKHIKSETLKNANNIFSKMLCTDQKFNLSSTAIKAYEHALNLEDESIRLYEDKYEKSENKGEKKVFRSLADEEKRHKLIIENILDFVRQPERERAVKTVDSDPEFARFENL
ncbi:ferritin-like domain-containing protein [Maledivibacter halophilus]|uniref:Rubrerythrin n=1 Tax=Maledivibacter halophilus TaxID=36842 RepID=A0A1T5MBU5_9FIRM|nr:ferritin family protein [Maledivibacter halophilus]SKC85563.1 Rubrerythrin [Maledivibacter halophilus]